MHQIHGSDPWIRSMDQIHGSDPWIRSMDQIHGSDPWIPRGSQEVPMGTQPAPKGSQETPRHFATKTNKLAKAFDKNRNGRLQNSSASSILKHCFLMIFRVRDAGNPGSPTPALNTPEPHSASTVWGARSFFERFQSRTRSEPEIL